ncbi:MAG: PVC-type heme-binding CxxCH protein [Planctomycetota bacterium]
MFQVRVCRSVTARSGPCLRALVASLFALAILASAVRAQEPAALNLAERNEQSGLRVADDLQLDLLLCDPEIANPLYLHFDERGRMWLVEYRQYPWPAGLKLVSRDNVWRNVYEPAFPPPPPHAADSPFRGKDRISVHEDTDGDGTFDRSHVFLDGLNLATAALPGRGGVFVLNPPYLLFYPDANQDALPDSETPRILLSGFGIEDTHSIANSLRWGPDGGLYGAHGSTGSASVVRHGADNQPLPSVEPIHTMGQFVWRYHPERHQYEVFAEGGGNAFGIEFDSRGRVYSGHNGGDTRGFYYVQGGYYLKNFGKHGSHSNPFTFGYYPAMKHPPVERFTHTFEIYEGPALPERYRGKLIGLAPHSHYIVASEIDAEGSGRQTRDLGKVIVPGDQPRDNWFTPVDIQTGPDGNLYLADWYAVQVNHYRGHEGQTNPDLGRVYRLKGKAGENYRLDGLDSASSEQLASDWLVHPNRWQRETALRLLAERRAVEVEPILRQHLRSSDSQTALNGLWALYQLGRFTPAVGAEALNHPASEVRMWAVRLVGDQQGELLQLVGALQELAARDSNCEVRLQLANTARKLPLGAGLELLGRLVTRGTDAEDVFIPLALWWGIEAHADSHEAIIAWAAVSDRWRGDLARASGIFPKLVRRAAMKGTRADLEFCGQLLALAPDEASREQLVGGFLQAYQGRSLPPLPEQLLEQLSRVKGPFADLLGLRRGDPLAVSRAITVIGDPSTDESQRIELIRTLAEMRGGELQVRQLLLKLLATKPSNALGAALLNGLQYGSDPQLAGEVLNLYPELSPPLQEVAISLLASRESWAGDLLTAVKAERVPLAALNSEIRQRLQNYRGELLNQLRAELVPAVSDEAKLLGDRLEAVEAIVRQGQGNPLAGQDLFHGAANCGKCHQMFGRGGEIGPELTSYNRNQLRLMLMAVINPSAEVREGYETLTVATVDGRVLSGFKLEENDETLVLRTVDGQTTTIVRTEIEEMAPSKLSLMPVGLLDSLTESQIRDLFAFLSSTTPPL